MNPVRESISYKEESQMSLNGKKISEFKLNAFQQNDFIEVTDKDLLGKWSVLFFYPADFTFVCPTELEDLQGKYADFQRIGDRKSVV